MSNTIHLQGIGKVPAKLAGDIQAGEILMWNYGYMSKVTRIVKTTEQQIVIETESAEDGKTYERRLSKSRMVAIGN